VEYQEWPFQGFLKRTRIGDKATTYNLEFKLKCILERCNLPIDPEALDISTNSETFVKAAISHEPIAYSKVHLVGLRPRAKRALWTLRGCDGSPYEGDGWPPMLPSPTRLRELSRCTTLRNPKSSIGRSKGANQLTFSSNWSILESTMSLSRVADSNQE
jgi:hypothetical protein